MSFQSLVITAPASSANLGPGFDVFGLALAEPHDIVKLTRIPEGLKVEISGLSAETIPTSPDKNTAGLVARLMMSEFSLGTGIHLRIEKGVLPGMGLGSSAASAAAVAFGLNCMFNLGLSNNELIRFAAKGELASAGAEHADNVSAAICGDFIIVKSYKPLEIIKLKAPPELRISVAYPRISTPSNKTEKARSAVPRQISIEKLVHNVGMAASLASGFANRDVEMIGDSMKDAIVEPRRAFLVPNYEKVKQNALKAGACGVAISGAGPAMIAIVNKKKANASKVAQAMKEGFESAGLLAEAFATKPGKGAHVLEIEK